MTPFQEILPLEWRSIPGFPDYAIREDGAIKRIVPDSKGRMSGMLMRQTPQHRGHLMVSLSFARKKYPQYVHRLVALAFIGPPPSDIHEAAHEDGIPGHNHWSNLNWKTPRENFMDQYRHGTDPTGERNGNSKLTWENVQQIRLNPDHLRVQQLAEKFGVHRQTILRARTRENWKEAVSI